MLPGGVDEGSECIDYNDSIYDNIEVPIMEKRSDILVGMPVYKGHREWILNDGLVGRFAHQYDFCDQMYIDNTLDDDSFYEELKLAQSQWSSPSVVEVRKHCWKPEDDWMLYMLGDCYNECIEYAIENGYKWFIWTAADTFIDDNNMPSKKVIDKLISYDLDFVSIPTNVYTVDGPPSVYKTPYWNWSEEKKRFEPDICSWEELQELGGGGLIKVWGSIGCVLLKVDALEKKGLRFVHPPDKHIAMGEDFFFIQKCEQEHVNVIVDTSMRAFNNTKGVDALNGGYKKAYYDKWVKKPLEPSKCRIIDIDGKKVKGDEVYA